MADANSSSSTIPLDTLIEGWCNTQLKVVNFNYTWTIENFSCWTMGAGEFLKSSTFSADPNDKKEHKWYLLLYPQSRTEESKEWMSIFLHPNHNGKANPVSAKYTLAILNAKGEQTVEQSQTHKFELGRGMGFAKFIQRDFVLDEQNGLLPDDKLTIVCKLSTVADKINETGHGKMKEASVPKNCILDDFGALLEGGLFTDCVLYSSDGKEFKAHKAVLACRSPVFASMFTHDTEEKQTGRVNIEDISAPVLGQLLHFVYTGNAPPLLAEQRMAGELLVAADKYQLDQLKALCELQIFRGLNKDNVCAMLALAERQNAEQLKSGAIEYINMHGDEVMESDGWNRMVSSHPELLKQLFRASRKRGGQDSGGGVGRPPKVRIL